ncbi:carbamoyltransferase HypF, partial [Candidatus Aerophobetes bacterium]|nr:carbamoyltransferase HypF [Candidatus Aerophobetes bacterium]
ISEEPIAYKDKEALERLNKIADFFLMHNREIQVRVDDSVVRVAKGKSLIIRRARGYAPQPIILKTKVKKNVLAVGGHLKNTFCLLRDDKAIVSHHIGDLENLEALSAFEEGIKHYSKIFYFTPELIACDLHPNYASTSFARNYARENSLPLVPVQHHHAHIASLLAEKGYEKKVIGVAFDGSGFGTDGSIWGGEFLISDTKSFRRAAHLRYVSLPGGEMAVKEPWRMALSYLYFIYGERTYELACQLLSGMVKSKQIKMMIGLISKRINCPLTSSAGRFFDAVSSLLGVREKVNYEGQAAIELEMRAEEKAEESYPFSIVEGKEKLIVDTFPVIRAVVEETKKGEDIKVIAGRFHFTLSCIILKICKVLRERYGIEVVALSGGVFQNMLLLKKTSFLLEKAGFEVLLHSLVPPNDGGISLGQAVVAYHMQEG